VPSPAELPFYTYLMAPEAPDPEMLAAGLVNRPNWMSEGACRNADQTVFFPARGASVLPALAVCSSCNVQPQCLRYALADSDLTGVWGGTSERGRRLMRSAANAKKPRIPGVD
jgi:WhiB family redox-sensing transcriptional regulator